MDKPRRHYILAENMDNERNIKIWEGLVPPTDNANIRTQIAKMFVSNNQDIGIYIYEKFSAREWI